jgi:hypothetical protein
MRTLRKGEKENLGDLHRPSIWHFAKVQFKMGGL